MRVYLSHPIRGSKGKDATEQDMRENNLTALEAGSHWRDVLMSKFNQPVDMYIPGEHDEFVLIAYKSGHLSEEQILDVDCKILDGCDMLLALNEDCISGGMRVEIDYALAHSIPVLYVADRGEKVEAESFNPADLKPGDRIKVKYPADGAFRADLKASGNIAIVETAHSTGNHDVRINGQLYGCAFEWIIGYAPESQPFDVKALKPGDRVCIQLGSFNTKTTRYAVRDHGNVFTITSRGCDGYWGSVAHHRCFMYYSEIIGRAV